MLAIRKFLILCLVVISVGLMAPVQHTGDRVFSDKIDVSSGQLILPTGDTDPGLGTTTGRVFWDQDGCLKILDNAGGGQRTRTICAPRIYYPEDYADSTPASDGIQGAIDAAAAEMEGGLVLLSFNNEVAATGHYPITAEADSLNYPGCALVVKPGVVLMGTAGGFGSNDGTVITLKSTALTNGVCLEGDSAAAVGFRIQVDGTISNASTMTGLTIGSKQYVSEWFVDDVAIRGAAGIGGATTDLATCLKVRALKGSMQRLKLYECSVGMLLENFSATQKPNAVSVYDSIFSSTWDANVKVTGDPAGFRLVNNTFEFDASNATLTNGIDATGMQAGDSMILVGNWIEGKAAAGLPDVDNGLLVKDGEIILLGNVFRGSSSMNCSIKADVAGTAVVAGFGNVFESTLSICDSSGGAAKWAISGGSLPSTVPSGFNVSPSTVLAADCTTAVAKRGSICIDSDDVAPAKVYWCSVASCSQAADWIQLGDGIGGVGDMTKAVYDTDNNGKVDTSDQHPTVTTSNAFAVYSDATGGLKDSLCLYSELGTTTKGGSIDCQANDAGPSQLKFYEDSDNQGTTPVDVLTIIGPSAIADGGVSCTLEADSNPMDSCITVGATIESVEITDGTITSADLGTDSVTSAEIAADAVGASEVAQDAIGTSELNDGVDSPVAGEIVAVAFGATSFEYLAQSSLSVGTATQLAANGSNCAAGQWAAGVDASGNAEGCTADDDVPDAGEVGDTALAAGAVDGGPGGEIQDNTITADDLAADSVTTSELDDGTSTPSNGQLVSVANATTGEFGYTDPSTLSVSSAKTLNDDGDTVNNVSVSGTNLAMDPDDDGTSEFTFCITAGKFTVMIEDMDTADGNTWTECGADDGVWSCGSDADGVCDGTI